MSAESAYESWLTGKGPKMGTEQYTDFDWHWLSFADGDDGHNLGIALVQGFGLLDAVAHAHYLGINPGGHVGEAEIPALLPEYANRLIGTQEATRISEDPAIPWTTPENIAAYLAYRATYQAPSDPEETR